MSDFGKSGKERVREYKAMESILRGETPEKRIIVGYKGKKKKLTGETIQGHLTDIMKEVRMPWFCPECKKTMKAKVNDKMWRLFGHCFDCQVKIENKLRIEGKYEEWAKKKVLLNQRSFVTEQLEGVEEWKTQGDVTFYNQVNPDGHTIEKETWSTDKEQLEKLATEAVDNYTDLLERINLELLKLDNEGVKNGSNINS
jgi:ribosomal protein L37AE/L43A